MNLSVRHEGQQSTMVIAAYARHTAYQALVADHLNIIKSDTVKNHTIIRLQLKHSVFSRDTNPIAKNDAGFLSRRGINISLDFEPFGLNLRKPYTTPGRAWLSTML